MENTLIEIGKELQKRMKLLNLSQKNIAAITKLSIKTVRAVMQGRGSVTMDNWMKVAIAVGATINITTIKMSDETRRSI